MSFKLEIPLFRSLITCVELVGDTQKILLGYSSGAIVCLRLSNYTIPVDSILEGDKTSSDRHILQAEVPELINFDHNSRVKSISCNKNTKMFASISSDMTVFVHSLTNGMFLNKIDLCPALVRVHEFWLSKNGYFTILGDIK